MTRPPEPAPTRHAVINGLLHALAVRELAAASLLNAEAEKVAHLARSMVKPETFDEVITFQRTVADLMNALVRKEEVLVRRLNAVLALCTDDEERSGKPTECVQMACAPPACAPTTCAPMTCAPTTCAPTAGEPSACEAVACEPTAGKPAACVPGAPAPAVACAGEDESPTT